MASLEQGELIAPDRPVLKLSRLRWGQVLAISIFWFALNFHWSAIGVIILPSQVFKLVGELHKGQALAFVLVPGAFVSLFANPLFGMLSDQTRGRLAVWGRRRPYILIGTLVNVVGLAGMALAPDITLLMIAYILVQFSSNAAQAPFHALLPDIVPPDQRGMASGVMGLLALLGNIAGVVTAGLFVDASKPLPDYQRTLWLIYGIIGAVLVLFMLITLLSVRERQGNREKVDVDSAGNAEQVERAEQPQSEPRSTVRPSWLNRSLAITVGGTLLTILALWLVMAFWNSILHPGGFTIPGDAQQVVLELIATVGILRLFRFNPRRTPDFAWVLFTRLLMMLGIYTIQDFLQYYLRDVVGIAHPEQEATKFILLVSVTSVAATLGAGWLSDRFGRKRIVYLSGMLMGVVGLLFIFLHDLPLVLAAGCVFGLGYGAYVAVDWALVADVLPSARDYARDMGVWNIALSLPQVIAPVLGGPLIDYFTRNQQPVLGFQILFGLAVVYCTLGTFTVRYIRGIAR